MLAPLTGAPAALLAQSDIRMNASRSEQIVVVGLGYVGLPLAVALARGFDVLGLDIDERRVEELRLGIDRTHEVTGEALAASALRLSGRTGDAAGADVYIVTV